MAPCKPKNRKICITNDINRTDINVYVILLNGVLTYVFIKSVTNCSLLIMTHFITTFNIPGNNFIKDLDTACGHTF